MTRLVMVLLALLMACSDGERGDSADENEPPPIGPGSDSTTLIPPDTPMTSREAAPRTTIPDTTTTTR